MVWGLGFRIKGSSGEDVKRSFKHPNLTKKRTPFGKIHGSELFVRIIWGVPKIRGTFLGVPIRRTTVFWGLYWGLPVLGNYNLGAISL